MSQLLTRNRNESIQKLFLILNLGEKYLASTHLRITLKFYTLNFTPLCSLCTSLRFHNCFCLALKLQRTEYFAWILTFELSSKDLSNIVAIKKIQRYTTHYSFCDSVVKVLKEENNNENSFPLANSKLK